MNLIPLGCQIGARFRLQIDYPRPIAQGLPSSDSRRNRRTPSRNSSLKIVPDLLKAIPSTLRLQRARAAVAGLIMRIVRRRRFVGLTVDAEDAKVALSSYWFLPRAALIYRRYET